MYLQKLFNYKSAASVLALAAALPLALTGCQDEEFGYSKEEIRAAAYDRNFVAKYGEVDPEMDWDLTRQVTGAFDDRTRALGNSGIDGNINTMPDWYYVDSKVVETFNDLLPESDASNKQKGKTDFHLESNGTFYIIPMYQGQSGLASDLWMHVEYEGQEADINLWQRSKDIQRQTVGSFGWRDLRYDWKALFGDDCNWNYFSTIDWYTFTSHEQYIASTRAAAGIRTKPIKCEIPVGAKIDFYLKITTGHVNYRQYGADYDRYAASAINTYNDTWKETHDYGISSNWAEANLAISGDEMWASKGKMIQLNQVDGLTIPDIEKLAGEGAQYMFIACEDAWSKGERAETVSYPSDRELKESDAKNNPEMYSKGEDGKTYVKLSPNDWGGDDDMNDLVFLFVSGKLPEVKEANTIKKRYIIEDLGSIVDWDFNDIVVDMEQVTNTKTGTIQQKATLKHLCGTTPFELFVGETNNEANSVKLNFGGDGLNMVNMAGKEVIDGQVLDQNVELNYEFYLPEAKWNPTTNNIWVKVYPKDRYSNSKHPDSEYEYTGTSGADNYGGELSQGYNNAAGNGEINATFDYGQFISFAFPRTGKVPRIIAVNPDHEWTAEHHDINPDIWKVYKVTVDKTGNGSVWGSGNYKPGTQIKLSAAPDAGSRFVKWSDDVTSPTRDVYVNSETTYTAIFENLLDEWNIWQGEATSLDNWGGLSISSNDLKQALEYGYNTVVLYGSKEGEFGLDINYTDYIHYGDAVNYPVASADGVYKGEYVLTTNQLKDIIDNDNKFNVRGRVESNGPQLIKVALKKTENTFTVQLIKQQEQHGRVEASDRSAGNWGEGEKNPSIRNGNNAYLEASYAAGTTVKLTPRADAGYLFDRWEQYDAADGNIINTDKGDANGVITVSSSAILKATFKEVGKIAYTVTTGETIVLEYRVKGSDGEYTEVASGAQLSNTSAQYEFRVKSVTLNNAEVKKLDDGGTDRYVVDWTNGSNTTKGIGATKTVTYDWNPAEGLALNLAVRYYVNPVRQLYDNTTSSAAINTAVGKVVIRAAGSDETFDNLAYYPIGTKVNLTAVANDGYKFKNWSNGETSVTRSQPYTLDGPWVTYADFSKVDASVIWQDDNGATVSAGQAFDKFAYGGQQALFDKLPASGNVTLRFTFSEPVTGNVRAFTPHESVDDEGFHGGWTNFEPGRTDNLENYGYYDITFSESEIARIKELGGLVLQNNTGDTFVIVEVKKL